MRTAVSTSVRRRTEELGVAIGLLTRYPLPAFKTRASVTIGSAFWAYPLAGALVGAPAAALFWLCIAAGFSTAVCALLAMAATVLASGGFHEDGLTDFWDGLGGGHSRDAKLAIMRDSRIGGYGALALFFTLGLQLAFLINIQNYVGQAGVMGAIIAAEALSRGAIALPLICLKPARSDGLGASMTALSSGAVSLGVILAAAIPIILLGTGGASMIAGGLFGAAAMTLLAWRFLQGFTGDLFGATAMTAKIAGLGAFALAVTP